jgi:GNAT superfamily N-acetyltransferase
MPTGPPSARNRACAPSPRDRAGALRLRDGCVVRLHALVLDPHGERGAIVADDGEGSAIGRVSYVRVYGPRAELALAVEDGWWRRGLAEALLEQLCDLAAGHGITTLLSRVPAPDVRLRTLLVVRFGAREEPAGRGVDLAITTRRRDGGGPAAAAPTVFLA